MIDTKLILLEGIPGSGKSHTSSFIANQLRKNGIEVDWYHENSKIHPTSFMYEACLDEAEYESFMAKYPHSGEILAAHSVIRGKNHFVDLMELKRHHGEALGEDALREIDEYDIWDWANTDEYIELMTEKWRIFAARTGANHRVVILDSSIFQYQIWTLLLRNTGKDRIKQFIHSLVDIVADLHPLLIFYYQNDPEAAIRSILAQRGETAINHLIERDKDSEYAKNCGQTGLERVVGFIKKYGEIADELAGDLPVQKIRIENSAREWVAYQHRILDFLGVQFRNDSPAAADLRDYVGYYKNERAKTVLDIGLHDNELVLFQGRKYLRYQEENIFYLGDVSVGFAFFRDQTGNVDGLRIIGVDICLDWTEIGMIFYKMKQ